MIETLEQMEARHSAERAKLVQRLVLKAYKAGADGEVPGQGPKLHVINMIVAQKYGLTPSQLLSYDRSRPIARARFEAFSRARKAGFSLPQIGRYWKRDHTTVMAGIRRHQEIVAEKTVGFDQ